MFSLSSSCWQAVVGRKLNWRQNLGDRVETAPYKTVVEADEFRIDRAEQNQQLLEPTDIGEVRNRVPRHDHFVTGVLLSSQSWDYLDMETVLSQPRWAQ
jgi:hypothetical protein